MDFSPDEWNIFGADDFELAEPRDPGVHGVEVMAQVRNTGRILDHFRLALGGSALLEAKFLLKHIMSSDRIPNIEIGYRIWPRDVKPRRNMTTTEWVDIRDLLAKRDVTLTDLDKNEEVEAANVLAGLDEIGGGPGKLSGSIRWGVCAGPDRRINLHLMALPSPLSTFSGKPVFRG